MANPSVIGRTVSTAVTRPSAPLTSGGKATPPHAGALAADRILPRGAKPAGLSLRGGNASAQPPGSMPAAAPHEPLTADRFVRHYLGPIATLAILPFSIAGAAIGLTSLHIAQQNRSELLNKIEPDADASVERQRAYDPRPRQQRPMLPTHESSTSAWLQSRPASSGGGQANSVPQY